MKNWKIIFSLLSVLLLCTTSCRKYPDGPAISLRSKAARLENNWKVGQALENGKDVTADYNKYELNMRKGGPAELSAKYKFFGTTYEFVTSGTWSFVSEKEKISFDFENDDADGVYFILKLKENEMWLLKDGDDVELHYIPNY